MVKTKDTSTWRVAGKSGVEAIAVEEIVCLLAIEPPGQDDTSKQPGIFRIGLGTQSAIDKERTH
jgi:hypothetical protein